MNKQHKIDKVFIKLNELNIRYCHFKSNANLDISFHGKTDFDIIVNKDDILKFKQILLEFGFKQRYATYDKVYVCMEDFLLYDEVQDVIHHFHIHYELMFGKKLEKRYYFDIDFEKYKMLDERFNIYILRPEIELIFLILRLIFKNQIKLRYIFRKSKMKISDSVYREFNTLLSQIDEIFFKTVLNEYFNDIQEVVIEFIHRYQNNNLNLFSVFKMSLEIEKNNIKSLIVVDSDLYRPLLEMKKQAAQNSYRWLHSGGKSIAIIGVDGSGKSTTVQELNKFLSYKLSTEIFYLGKVQTTKLKTLKFFANLFKNIGLKYFHKLISGYAQYYVAQVKYNIVQKSKSNLKLGVLTIFDRYPLKEFFNMNDPMDGPKLTEKDNCYFRRLEYEEFCKIDDYPDLLIILDIDLETSISRKQEHKKIQTRLKQKVEAVQRINLEKINTKFLIVDAKQEYSKVLSNIKKFVWDNL